MPKNIVRKAVITSIYTALSACMVSACVEANAATYNVSSDTTNGISTLSGPSVINLNGYSYSSSSLYGTSGDNLTVNGPGTISVDNGGAVPNLTINNASFKVNPDASGAVWFWATTGTAPQHDSPDDYLPLLNGTLTLNNVALTNWSGVRANTFVTSGNTSLTQIVNGFSGSFAGNHLINTGTLTISSKNPAAHSVNNDGGNLLITKSIKNTGNVDVNKGGSLYLGYALSGLPETITGDVGNVNVNGGTLFMNNMNNVSGNINESGGLVSGYGTFNGNITNDGGSFFPGNNLTFTESKNGIFYVPTELPNQMTINGNYTQNGASTYVAYIWPGNDHNTKLVVNGNAKIAGTLAVTAESSEELQVYNGKGYNLDNPKADNLKPKPGPDYVAHTHYTLISAKNVSGTFSKAVYVDNSNFKAVSKSINGISQINPAKTSSKPSDSINGLTPYLAYGSQKVQLWLCKAGAGYCGTALKVVDPKLVSADSVPHTTLAQVEFTGGAIVSNIIGGAPAGAWIKALGNFGHLDGYNSSGAGAVAGYGFHTDTPSGDWVFGPAFSYGHNSIGSSYSNTTTDSYGFWLYGGWHQNSWKVAAVGGGGFTQNNERTDFDGIKSSPSNYSGSFWDIAVRPSYWLHMDNGLVLSPRVTFNYGSARTSAFAQTFGPTNYSIGSAKYSVFTVSPVMLVGDKIGLGDVSIDPQLRVGLNENIGHTTTFGLPHTQGTAEARVDVDESKDLFGVLSWKYTYGGGRGYGYNTIMASARYLW